MGPYCTLDWVCRFIYLTRVYSRPYQAQRASGLLGFGHISLRIEGLVLGRSGFRRGLGFQALRFQSELHINQ